MESKQTAIEWLVTELKKTDMGKNLLEQTYNKTLINKAKEMEREQILAAANLSIKDRWYDATKFSNCGEQHYAKTYGM